MPQGGGYPNRPVRVIVGFTAGGPTDVIARLIAQKLSEGLGQNFYVENVPGAGGNIAAAQTARAAADGYTLHVVSTGFIVNPSLYSPQRRLRSGEGLRAGLDAGDLAQHHQPQSECAGQDRARN